MANLAFTKQGEHWVATATITADATLHVERKASAFFGMGQKSASTDSKYANVPQAQTYDCNIDTDIVAAKYPKHVRFVSESEVLNAHLD